MTIWRLGFDVCLVVGPTLGYLAQFLRIKEEKCSEAFSLSVSFILIGSALMRYVPIGATLSPLRGHARPSRCSRGKPIVLFTLQVAGGLVWKKCALMFLTSH